MSSALPAGVCDTHMHFYDARYEAAPAAVLRPPDATVEQYRTLQADLGLDRVVVVQPTTYGLDNSCQLGAMASFGERARGVMVVDHRTSPAELGRLSDLGVCGARFHMLPGGAVPWDIIDRVAENIAPYGWHIQLQFNGRELPDRLDHLRRLPVDLVFDHVARFMPPVSVDDEAFSALLALVDEGARVKLSAPYESSVAGPPGYSDVVPLVEELIARAPQQLLWATNWPHPGQGTPPTATDLAAMLASWLPTDAIRKQVLVDNPAEFYGFTPRNT